MVTTFGRSLLSGFTSSHKKLTLISGGYYFRGGGGGYYRNFRVLHCVIELLIINVYVAGQFVP